MFLETLRHNRKPAVLPVVPFESEARVVVNLVKFTLLKLFALDGGVQSYVVSSHTLKTQGDSFVARG